MKLPLLAAAAFGCAVGALTSHVAYAGTSSAFDAKADRIVAEKSAPQHNHPPMSGPKLVHGKTVVIIPCAMAAEGCARPARGVEEAAKLVGWNPVLIDGAGDPSKMANAVQRAISIKADAIVLTAIDSSSILGPLQEAKKAGIKVVGLGLVDKTRILDDLIPAEDSFIDDGYTMGATAYKLAGHNLKMIEMRGDEFGGVANRAHGTEKFVKDCQAAGGACQILASENFLVTDLTTRVPEQATAQVRRHPDFNVLWAGYDAGLNFMIQGLKSANLTDSGFAVGFDSNVANLDIIRDGGFQRASVGLPMEWIGFGAIDDLIRIFNGQKPVDQGVHSELLLKSNLPASGPYVGTYDFRTAYKKIWGIK
jgi:ribose transport system substrate-binding protein